MAEKGKDKEKEEGKGQAEEAALDPKYLAVLTYRDAEERDVEDQGVKKKKKFPREATMKMKHVRSWTDSGKEIVIVSADGRKHRVKK